MLHAIEAVLPMFVTMALGYSAAAHHRFEPDQVPTLNQIVLVYAVPMSIAADVLRTPRATMLGDVRLMLVLALALAASYFIVFILTRYVARQDAATSALYALAIAFPAVPITGPAILPELFGPRSAGLIVSCSLVGNVVLVPATLIFIAASGKIPAVVGAKRSEPGSNSADSAVVSALKRPLVWAPALAFVIVIFGLQLPSFFDDSLALLGHSAGGLGLFTAGIILRSQRISLHPAVVVAALGRNVLAPLAVLAITFACGLGAAGAGEAGVAASLLAPPIIVTLAVEYGFAEQEMSSTLLLSALASPFTNAAFVAFASHFGSASIAPSGVG
jgi:malonate transporter and related proteins